MEVELHRPRTGPPGVELVRRGSTCDPLPSASSRREGDNRDSPVLAGRGASEEYADRIKEERGIFSGNQPGVQEDSEDTHREKTNGRAKNGCPGNLKVDGECGKG